jgi:hypothetical protein
VFRSGEHKLPGAADEPQRIILYLKGAVLDQAEVQADRGGFPTIQEYCADLLARAIETERIRHHVADVEAKRGPLDGFKEISVDANYLAEWHRRLESGEIQSATPPPPGTANPSATPDMFIPLDALSSFSLAEPPGSSPQNDEGASEYLPPESVAAGEPSERPRVRIEMRPAPEPAIIERMVPELMEATAVEIVLAHIGPGDVESQAFLPCLRRGQAEKPGRASELLHALVQIEAEQGGAPTLDRQLSYALHRLAMESQVLLTEAWPGVFDQSTVGTIRAVQEMVERILSGQDVRFYQPGEIPDAEPQP